ncbi:hypothetical protein C4D60_Mb04t27650 [Musa balbisiana]|uniref:Rieske domain-containing protein n=1 Tax=Musa balbisiana TaxID=52838 RepID=A0A4S8KF45_MUSBA|nr:hypothetical protein C4D60_Mb04t27650 [Musa balbisiana]
MALPSCLPSLQKPSPRVSSAFLRRPLLVASTKGKPGAATSRRRWRRGTGSVAAGPMSAEEVLLRPEEEEVKEEYDWREEWYPLYLTAEVPEDAPLAHTVFDEKIVLFRDGNGVIRCFQDRCPHRLAKLSEGQLVDGRLECLYHGWQFGDDGKCLKIPQLPDGARIPRSACVRTYETRDSQGVVWVWMSDKNPPDENKLPWFEHYARPGFQDVSTIHELPYDHSILLENFMDPAHVPISHDRTDFYSKREDAQALLFEVTKRSGRGFAGSWSKSKPPALTNLLRFEAPCILQNSNEYIDKDGTKQYVSALFLCRPTGQGKSMVIIRFGSTLRSPIVRLLPTWFFHQNICKVLEQDMGFLSSQNEILWKEKAPTGRLYINLKSCDTWVAEYRRWKDKVGHGMPYFFGHNSCSLAEDPAVVEHAPAGLTAGISSSMPAKGATGDIHAPNPINRYFRHIIHCKECRSAVKSFQVWRNTFVFMAFTSISMAILASRRQWKAFFLVSAAFCMAGAHACSSALSLIKTNFIRGHRRL